MKDQTYWAAYSSEGHILTDTVSYRRKDSITAAEFLPEWPWERMKKRGWKVHKIKITKIEE